MKNLLKLELRGLKKKKSFYICMGIMVAMLLLTTLMNKLLMDMTAEFAPGLELSPELSPDFAMTGMDTLISTMNNSSFTLVIGIFVSIFVCEDYAYKIVKNIFSRGYTRRQVYMAKLVSSLISATVMFLVVELAGFAIGAAFFGWKAPADLSFLGVLGTQYVIVMGFVCLSFLIASVIRRNGGAIATIVVVPTVIDLVLTLIDLFGGNGSSDFADGWLSTMLLDASVLSVSADRLLACLGISLAYILVFAGTGYFLSNKNDL